MSWHGAMPLGEEQLLVSEVTGWFAQCVGYRRGRGGQGTLGTRQLRQQGVDRRARVRRGAVLAALVLVGTTALPVASSSAQGSAPMPAASLAVGAPTPPKSTTAFADVPGAAYYSQGVAWLVDEGATVVPTNRRFGPDGVVSRAQMALFLYRIGGSPTVETSCGLVDLPTAASAELRRAACWLKAQGVTTGLNGDVTRFGPSGSVTRGQMALFLTRLAAGTATDLGLAPCGVADPPASPELNEAICFLVTTGVSTGVGGTSRFAPAELVRRGQMAAFLFRLAGAPSVWDTDRLLPAAYDCSVLDTSDCLLPFPNDRFTTTDAGTDTGRRLNISRAATPANAQGRRIDPYEQNRNDGFSPGQPLLVHLPGVDLAATGMPTVDDIDASQDQDAPVVIIDTDTGVRSPYWVEIDSLSTPEAGQLTQILPAVNLREGARYLVGIRDLRTTAGEPAEEVSEAFAAVRDAPDVASAVPVVEAQRADIARVIDELEDFAVERDELYLAWEFTVASERNLSERLLHLRDDAFGRLGTGTPRVTITEVNPVGSQSANDNCVDVICVSGSVRVPNYLTGKGFTGATLNWGPDGRPVRNVDSPGSSATIEAPITCVVPPTATGANRARPSLYGHGLLGLSIETAIAGAPTALEHNMVFCGTDWIGMSGFDIGTVSNLLSDLSLFPTLPDRGQQGMLNFLYLGRALKKGLTSNVVAGCAAGKACPNPFSDGGQSIIDTSEVFYVGNSQGGIKGGALMAVGQDFTRGLLGVPGMNYSTMLRRSSNWNQFRVVFDAAYPDPFVRPLAIGLVQLLWDRSEANGYAHHVTADPYPNTPAKQVLLFTAFGDYQVANVATGVMARTYGAKLRGPAMDQATRAGQDYFLWGLEELDATTLAQTPFRDSAMVVWDFGTPEPPRTNLAPGRDRAPWSAFPDPHGLGGRLAEVRQMASAFLRGAGEGRFIDACDGAPCRTVGP